MGLYFWPFIFFVECISDLDYYMIDMIKMQIMWYFLYAWWLIYSRMELNYI